MDTIREQVVQAVIARLGSLTTNAVLRREQYEDEDEFVCVWDGEHVSERTKYGSLKHTLDLTVEYVKQSVVGSPAVAANAMYAEAVAALFSDGTQFDLTLGGLAQSMSETSFLPLTPESGLNVTGAGIKLEVVFETANGDPYTAP